MKTTKLKAVLSKKFDVQINDLDTNRLFEKYESIGFIYPAKKKLLAPFFEDIRQNWTRMLAKQKALLWVLNSTDSTNPEHFASIAFWKQSNHSCFAQHLVSTGKPTQSLKVMLAAQYAVEVLFEDNEIQASQNWFRPNNRYAYRIFASMFEDLGERKAFLKRFQYLHLPLQAIKPSYSAEFSIERIKGIHQPFIDFVTQEYSQVFVTGEELDQEDIELSKVGEQYRAKGLKRAREVYVIKEAKSKEIVASVIANRAPLGINFSFLENRAYYIIKKDVSAAVRQELLQLMHQVVQTTYSDFQLEAIPIITDKPTAELLQTQGAIFQREYMQSIWLRSGFLQWYDHIYTFLQRLEAREMAKKMLRKKSPEIQAVAV